MATTTSTKKITILKTAEKTVEAEFYTNANGRDYFEVIKNSVPTQTFIDVAEGASSKDVAAAYEAGALV
jgi:hypothetical protein